MERPIISIFPFCCEADGVLPSNWNGGLRLKPTGGTLPDRFGGFKGSSLRLLVGCDGGGCGGGHWISDFTERSTTRETHQLASLALCREAKENYVDDGLHERLLQTRSHSLQR